MNGHACVKRASGNLARCNYSGGNPTKLVFLR